MVSQNTTDSSASMIGSPSHGEVTRWSTRWSKSRARVSPSCDTARCATRSASAYSDFTASSRKLPLNWRRSSRARASTSSGVGGIARSITESFIGNA